MQPMIRSGQLIGLLRRHAARAVWFGAHFGLSKAVAFIGPLAIASVLAPETYATLEVAISWALLLALGLNLGLPSAYPQLTLLRRPTPADDILGLQLGLTTMALLALVAVAWALGRLEAALICAVTTIALMQSTAGMYFRTKAKSELAAWSTSLILVSSTAVVFLASALGPPTLGKITFGHAALAAAALPVIALWTQRTWSPDIADRSRRALKLGLPLMASGLVTLWLSTSGRILLGQFLPAADVAVFAFVARITGAAVIVHQVVMMVWFSRLYRMRARAFDKLASIYLLFTTIVSLAIIVLVPLVLPHVQLKAIPQAEYGRVLSILPVVSLQIFAINVTAALDLRINRYRLTEKSAVFNIVIAVLTIGVAVWLAADGSMTLATGTWLTTIQWLAVPAGQLLLLMHKRLPMPRVLGILTLATAIMSGISYVY